jgi:hypothetical protein
MLFQISLHVALACGRNGHSFRMAAGRRLLNRDAKRRVAAQNKGKPVKSEVLNQASS